MPRDRQAPKAPNDQAYGMRGDQIAAQQAIPLPQQQTPAGQMAQQQPEMNVVEQARQFDPGITPLTAPTERPGEPVQAGLAMGPGPGPDIFSQPARANAAADVLVALAQSSGNDEMLELANRIRQSGGLR